MKNRTRVYFFIEGFPMLPEELTKMLECEPSKTRKIGDILVSPKHPARQNSWEIKSELPESESLENHIEEIINKIRPNIESFIKICNQYQSGLLCAIDIYDRKEPPLYFDEKIISFLGKLNASLDIDQYLMD